MTALALFFSCFSSPMLSTLFTLGIYVTGVFATDIRDFGELTQNPALKVGDAGALLSGSEFSQFQRDWRRRRTANRFPPALIWQNTLYAVLYVDVAAGGGLRRIFEAQFEVSGSRAKTRVSWAVSGGRAAAFRGDRRVADAHRRADARSAAQQKEELLAALARRHAKAEPGLRFAARRHLLDARRAVLRHAQRERQANFDLLWPLLDIATTLDPKAHRRVSLRRDFSLRAGRWARNRTDLAIELVKRGIAANPDKWRLNGDLGFLYYWRMQGLPRIPQPPISKAARTRGAAVDEDDGGPRGGQRADRFETSRMIWSEIYESTNDPRIRKTASKN